MDVNIVTLKDSDHILILNGEIFIFSYIEVAINARICL